MLSAKQIVILDELNSSGVLTLEVKKSRAGYRNKDGKVVARIIDIQELEEMDVVFVTGAEVRFTNYGEKYYDVNHGK